MIVNLRGLIAAAVLGGGTTAVMQIVGNPPMWLTYSVAGIIGALVAFMMPPKRGKQETKP